MKITITRSFSRTKQIAQFEPINAHCSVSVEVENSARSQNELTTDIQAYTKYLDIICRQEVEKTIEGEIAKRRPIDTKKIHDTAQVEAEADAGHQAVTGWKEK